MANGVTLIAGHNIIMTTDLADSKFAKGEITNRKIVTTEEDFRAAREGKVGTLEEQTPAVQWQNNDVLAQEEKNHQIGDLEQAALEEAREYISDGQVDWSKVANDPAPLTSILAVPTANTSQPDTILIRQEFEEFLQWKQQKQRLQEDK